MSVQHTAWEESVARRLGITGATQGTYTQTYATASRTIAALVAAALTENSGALGGTNDGNLPDLTATYTALTGAGSGTANGALEAEGTVSTAGGNTYADSAVNTVFGKIENNITELATVIAQLAADNVALRAAVRECAAMINTLRADVLDMKKNDNGIIDDLQAALVVG